MSMLGDNESSLARLIGSELNHLSRQVEVDIKQRSTAKKYLSQVLRAFEQSDIETLNSLLLRQTKDQLLTHYPIAEDIFEKLSVDVRRRSEHAFLSLFTRFQEYCEKERISLRGTMPKLSVDNLLEVEVDKKKRATRIGTVFLRTVEWEKIKVALDRERHRVWRREFDPAIFRDNLLEAHSELLRIKPNPVGWVRLAHVYQALKAHIEKRNPNWKTGGRLVAYYKDEFSADLSKLWGAQMSQQIDFPHVELSGIRDPRLSYRVVLPDGQIGSYGHLRPKKDGA